jgi:hypothetical protein
MVKKQQPPLTLSVRRGVLVLCLVLVSCRYASGEKHATRRTDPVILVDVNLPVTPKQFKDLWMDTGFSLNYLQRIGTWVYATLLPPILHRLPSLFDSFI